jgi:uncharacterized RDD family membrane protein YckC
MNLANWIQRVGGYIIDALPAAVVGGIGYAIDGPKVNSDGTTSGVGAIYWICVLLSLAWLIYNRWYLGGKGQSIGKRALGMHLIKEQTGQPIGMGLAFGRDICHIVDSIICYIGWLFPLWDQKRQTLADKIVGTLVTKD